MELKFIWIKDYKNIKSTGFNFTHSSDEHFEFIDNKILINKKISSIPKNFFNNNISSVTAIVGKNGSGKTNLTEFINYNLAHAANRGLSTYIHSEGITIIDKWIFVQQDITIDNYDYLISKGYSILKYKDAPLDNSEGEMSWHEMERNKYIYYNPAFDHRAISVKDNLVNISTTMLVYNDLYNSEKLYSYAVGDNHRINQLSAFEDMEKSRICDFILNYEKANDYIDFLPEKIRISIDTNENNSFLKKNYFYDEPEEDPKYEILSSLQTELENLEKYQLFVYNFENYFVHQRENSVIKYYSIPTAEQKEIFFRLFFIQVFQVLLNKKIIFPFDYFRSFLYNEVQEDQFEDLQTHNAIYKLKDEILKIIDLSDWYEFYLPLSEKGYDKEDEIKKTIYKYLGHLDIKISNNKRLIKKTISSCDELLNNKRMFSYEPTLEFSSGQKNILALYSRFFWAKNKIEEKELERDGITGDSIIIFIDEGEVALHPEWQRVFFNKITNFLSDLFYNKNIQLIITTHSPFVLSDIPKDNVLFLERDKNGHCQLSNFEKENTFGANIYSLLSDSFFMRNTIGEFAEEKMKWALKILSSNHNDYSEDVIFELKYIIDGIGEPMINEQFEYLFNKKFMGDEVSVLKNQIVYLQKQLNKEQNDTFEN